MLVLNTQARDLFISSADVPRVALVPGPNEVRREVWERVKTHPFTKAALDEGWIRVLSTEHPETQKVDGDNRQKVHGDNKRR